MEFQIIELKTRDTNKAMELKEFIKNVLLDIAEGVKDAQEKGMGLGAVISPNYRQTDYTMSYENKPIQIVEFEVELSTESMDGSRGIGVSLANAASFKLDGKDNQRKNNSTKIKFDIPMVLPTPENKMGQVIHHHS